MKKQAVSFVMILILVVSILPIYASAAGSLSNFSIKKTYPAGHFTDVADAWYAPAVKASFEYTLVDGTTPTTFSPEKNLTLAEAIKLAACLNSVYSTGATTLKNGSPLWYQTYVDYALTHDILQAPYVNYTAYATRADMAVIFANALPDDALMPINTIGDNTIPDVSVSASYGHAVYKLYRAGILTGIDDSHTYKPNDTISRAETAAIVTRMANIGRKAFSMSSTVIPSDTPKTTELTITANTSAISVAAGAQAAVSYTVSAPGFDRIIPVIENPSVVSCTWGIPSGNDFPMTIIGLSAGTSYIKVELRDAGNNILAQATIDVTVTGGGTTTTTAYFPGYYPVPDYGVYVGTTHNIIKYDALNGSTFYTYRIADMAVDMDYAVNGYMSLLVLNGFTFDYSFINPDDGAVIFVYGNSDYHLKVFLTDAKMNNVPSVIVKVTPF